MIIHDLDVFRAIGARRPLETEAPLLVDPNAVLAFPVAGQSLQMVPRELCQIPQAGGCFQDPQAFFGLAAKSLESGNSLAFGETFGSAILVAADQSLSMPGNTQYVKRTYGRGRTSIRRRRTCTLFDWRRIPD